MAYTQRNGSLQTGGPVNNIYGSIKSERGGFLIENTSAVPVNIKFKNQGWYASGGAYETWVSIISPSSIPPSGHSLTDISYVIFNDTASL